MTEIEAVRAMAEAMVTVAHNVADDILTNAEAAATAIVDTAKNEAEHLVERAEAEIAEAAAARVSVRARRIAALKELQAALAAEDA
ncbi:hypothetical protein [Thiomonas sp.]